MPKKEVKILILENSMEDVHLILESLGKADIDRFHTQYANSLSFGIKCLTKEEFDLVILDLVLPDSVGFEPIKKLRKNFPDIPIVVLTGLNEELKSKALTLGVHTYLIKDKTNKEILSETIHSIMA